MTPSDVSFFTLALDETDAHSLARSHSSSRLKVFVLWKENRQEESQKKKTPERSRRGANNDFAVLGWTWPDFL